MTDPGFHTACLLFPPLPPAEFDALVADIAANGLLHPIVLHDGLVLDGRNRLLACRRAGREPRFTEWKGEGSPLSWAISTNMQRRHLSTSQRAVLALDLLPLLASEAKQRQRLSRGRGRRVEPGARVTVFRGKASQAAARLAATNSAYVERAKRLRAHHDELLEPVRLGHLTLSEATQLAKIPAAARTRAVELRRIDPSRRMADVLRESLATISPAPLQHRVRTGRVRIWCGDCLHLMRTLLADASVDVVCTSPPYNVGVKYRSYADQRPDAEYFAWLDEVFGELRRAMKATGSLFLVAGHTPRHPWRSAEIARVAATHFVLQNQIAWIKSVEVDGRTRGHLRPISGQRHLNRTWEQVWHFSIDGKATLDRQAVGVVTSHDVNRVRGGDGSGIHCPGDAWFIPHETVQSGATRASHPATFPAALVEKCLRLAGVKRSSLVLDPFCGVNGIAAAAALGAKGIGIDIEPSYCENAAAACGTIVERRPRRPK